MKIEQFRKIDILIFLVLMVFSGIASFFLSRSLDNDFYLSFSVLLLGIIMIRWKYIGIIPYAISQIILSLVQIVGFNYDIGITLTANIGGCVLLPLLPLVLNKLKFEIKENAFGLALYLLLVFILVGIGQSLVLLIVGETNIIGNFVFFMFKQEPLSFIVSLILIMLLRNSDNLMVDVKKHIINLRKEEGINGRI